MPVFALLLVALSAQAPFETSFEDFAPGPLTSASCGLGSFAALEDHASIDDAHAASGKQCLHIRGGPRRRVLLELTGGPMPVAELRFQAERWTRRDPFQFTVEVHGEDGWRTAFDGSDSVRVGARFLSSVRVPIDDAIDQVRFQCTSPTGSGILLDDLALIMPGPLVLERVHLTRPTLPVLVDEAWSPLARLDLDVKGTEGALGLSRAAVHLRASGGVAVQDVALFIGPASLDYRKPSEALPPSSRWGTASRSSGGLWTVTSDRPLDVRESSSLWIFAALEPGADLDGHLVASCPELTINGEAHAPLDPAGSSPQRLGLALRSAGDDGSAAFRIPGLATTNAGSLIAVYDVRWKGWGDIPGDVDVGMRRSTDGGRTWDPQAIIMDIQGDGDPQWQGDGIGDPSVLVDRATGRIFVLATWSHGNRAWRGSGPGLTPEETGQLMLTTSDDDGQTWSELRNLTAELKDPSWSYLLQGPGRGITMHDGTLVFPAQFQAPPEEGRTPFSTVITSADSGKTWRIGTGVRPDTTESAVVELADGILMLSMRDNRGGTRSVHTSADLGTTWSAHPTSRQALPDPVCMASLIHVGRELTGAGDGRLVFSNPNVSSAPRRRLSLQASVDSGESWLPRALLLDEGQSAGYSCLTMIDESTLGVLYEGSRAHLTFQRIPLSELFARGR